MKELASAQGNILDNQVGSEKIVLILPMNEVLFCNRIHFSLILKLISAGTSEISTTNETEVVGHNGCTGRVVKY